jgi:orotate phosphoribosyltransferase
MKVREPSCYLRRSIKNKNTKANLIEIRLILSVALIVEDVITAKIIKR